MSVFFRLWRGWLAVALAGLAGLKRFLIAISSEPTIGAVGIEVGYTEPLEVIRRYEELLSSGVGTAA